MSNKILKIKNIYNLRIRTKKAQATMIVRNEKEIQNIKNEEVNSAGRRMKSYDPLILKTLLGCQNTTTEVSRSVSDIIIVKSKSCPFRSTLNINGQLKNKK